MSKKESNRTQPTASAQNDQTDRPKESKEPWLNPEAPVEGRVLQWLDSVGYPLEFRATDALEKAGFAVDQGHHVTGNEPGSALEIDALAYAESEPARFELVVECEVVPRPRVWVAFAADAPRSPINGIAYSTSADLRRRDPAFAEPFERLRVATMPFVETAFVLRTLGRDKTDKDKSDPAYRAVNSLLARAMARAAEMDFRDLALIAPALVIDGDLALARWSGGKFSVSPAKHVQIVWRGFGQWPTPFAWLDVIQIDALPALAARRRNDAQIWVNEVRAAGAAASRASETAKKVALAREFGNG